MRTVIIKAYNPISNPDEVQSQLEAIQAVFCAEFNNGNPIPGTGYSIVERLDDDHIKVWVRSMDEVIEQLLSDPRVELIEEIPEDSEEEVV